MKIDIDTILDKRIKSRYWLAKEIGMTYRNLMRLCNDETTSIKFVIIEKICNVLECTPNDILILDKNNKKTDDI